LIPCCAPTANREARIPDPDPGSRRWPRPATTSTTRHPSLLATPATTLRQDCGGVRLQVRLLHHPHAARQLPQPPADSIVRRRGRWPRAGVKELLLISRHQLLRRDPASAARSLASARLNAVDASSGSGCSTSTRPIGRLLDGGRWRRSATTCWLQHASDSVERMNVRHAPATSALERIRRRIPRSHS